MSEFYQKEANIVLDELGTSPEEGLTPERAAQLIEEYGPNELVETAKKSPWLILWEQMTSIMVVILIIAAVISLFYGEELDALKAVLDRLAEVTAEEQR